MAGRTDPDSVRVVVEGVPIGLTHAARDQVAAWLDDPSPPASIRVWFEGRMLTLTRG